MKLSELKPLFIDCQTTGMRPPAGHLLDIAWCLGDEPIEHSLVQLPDGQEISRKISEITGLKNEDLKDAKPLKEIFLNLDRSTKLADLSLIHYAQFEKPFLNDLYAREESEFSLEIFCVQALSKKLLPNLPSHNIRAVAGYFGHTISHVQRAKTHVEATREIWRNLLKELEAKGLETLEQLRAWQSVAQRAKTPRYEYRIDKLKRLELPDQPGIYRMIAKNGEVLYVGKATSLKSRVNSYFRGQKNRNKQKLELLAQVWDLRVTGCATPLEAALMETDEIKRYNPRYNVVLKRGTRHIVFYDRNFKSARREQDEKFRLGPFRNFNWIETLRDLATALAAGQDIGQIFFEPIDHELIQEGYKIFCERFQPPKLDSIRKLLTFGLKLSRQIEEEVEQEDDPEEERELTAPDVAGKFERLLIRAGLEYRRGKALTKLLNATIEIQTRAGARRLSFLNGQMTGEGAQTLKAQSPWKGLGIDDFDRMSILKSEMEKCSGKILAGPPNC